eukprot:maker-scaffold_6-snap-gene-19.43-mRNA-1 protein AED:0.20 eAED:0.20 QI:151/1/1/1/1/1/5/458/454
MWKRVQEDPVFFISSLGNFSAAYNLAINGHILLLLELSGYPASEEQSSALAASALIGAISGQLIFGYAGNNYSVDRCLTATLLVSTFGNLFSVVFAWGGLLFSMLILGRFIAGLGAGGIYPLSAIASSNSTKVGNKGKRVMLVFSFQGVAQLFAPFSVLFLDFILPRLAQASLRILLLIGALPSSFALPIALGLSAENNNVEDEELLSEDGKLQKTFHKVRSFSFEETSIKKNIVLLLGTAGSWFIFDVVFYGNVIFTPFMLKSLFSSSEEDEEEFNTAEGKLKLAKYSTIIYVFALSGLYLAVFMSEKLSRKSIQMIGFSSCALLFCFLGFFNVGKMTMFAVYLMTFFFYNFGPNATTFVLPSETFDDSVKSLYNGISAACGKVGAVIGASLFKVVLDEYHLKDTFFVCGVLCLVGSLVTLLFVVENNPGETDEKNSLTRELNKTESSDINIS